MKYLGETLDIHCGGIDHIPVHNTNEIAQSECATGHTFARFWIHGAFLNVVSPSADAAGGKMSKSGDNFLTVQRLIDRGYDPLAYRYLCLTAHYRSELAFNVETWESLGAATKALGKIYEMKARIGENDGLSEQEYIRAYQMVFDALSDDLNLPRAIAALHEAKSYRLWREFDSVLGLDIETRSRDVLPTVENDEDELSPEIIALKQQRDEARKARDFARSDALRAEIEGRGYTVGDSPLGTVVKKNLL
jgi:cysteinyl-tRNA synthetase